MKWITLGTKLFPLIIMAVQAVEKLLTAKHGKDKQDAAVDLVGVWLTTLEAGLNKDLLDNAEVQAAMRKLIDAYVAWQNVLAKTQAAPEGSAVSILD